MDLLHTNFTYRSKFIYKLPTNFLITNFIKVIIIIINIIITFNIIINYINIIIIIIIKN